VKQAAGSRSWPTKCSDSRTRVERDQSDIETLVQTIQADTNEAVQLDGADDLRSGSPVARLAEGRGYRALGEIESVSSEPGRPHSGISSAQRSSSSARRREHHPGDEHDPVRSPRRPTQGANQTAESIGNLAQARGTTCVARFADFKLPA
jgi:hypothetical protein